MGYRERALPPPLAGEVDERSSSGGGTLERSISSSPTLPRKRGRERARYVATVVLMFAAVISNSAFPQTPQFAPRDEKPEDFPAGPGRDDTFYACTACHNFKLVVQQGMTRRQWEDSLQWMTDRHGMSPLPAKEQKIVLDYLEATFPPRTPAGRGGFQNPFAPR